MNIKLFCELWNDATVVELGQYLEPHIPVWPTHARFVIQPWESKAQGDVVNHFYFGMGDHNGTHIDSSFHYYDREKGSRSIDEYPAEKFCGPCSVLRFHGMKAGETISKTDIQIWESEHSPIEQGDIVLIDFGWGKFFATLPEGKVFLAGWPGVSGEAAAYLLEKKIKMLGVDPCAVDASGAVNDPAHNTLLPNEVLIIETLANLDKLPNRVFFIALPLRIKGGSGSPVRAIALY